MTAAPPKTGKRAYRVLLDRAEHAALTADGESLVDLVRAGGRALWSEAQAAARFGPSTICMTTLLPVDRYALLYDVVAHALMQGEQRANDLALAEDGQAGRVRLDGRDVSSLWKLQTERNRQVSELLDLLPPPAA